MKKLSNLLIVVLLGLSFAAWMTCCGGGGNGGGGGGGDGSSDTTPPVISSTSPSDGTTDVAVDTSVSATFNEAMSTSTITTSTFFVVSSGSTDVDGAVSYDTNTNIAIFTPTNSLNGGTTYTATISTGVTDAAGNALAANYSWSFTTVAVQGQWQQLGGQVSPSGAESEDPVMLVIDSTPAVGYRHESFRTYLNVWGGSNWGTSELDPSDNNTESSIYSTPDFCSDGDSIYMAYSHTGDSSSSGAAFYERVFVYKWDDTNKWTIQNDGYEVSNPYVAPPSADAWEPAIAIRLSGNPVVTWVEWNAPSGSDNDVWVAEVTSSSVARSAALSRNNSAGSYSTDVRTVGITVDSSGNTFVAQWEQNQSEQWRTDLYVTQYSGGSFTNLGDSIATDYDPNNLSVPSLAVIGTTLYVAYSVANITDYTKHVYVKKYDGNWTTVGGGPVSAFSTPDHYDSANPDLLIINGTIYLAWEESSQYEGYFIYVAYWDDNAGLWIIDGDRLNVDTANSAHDPSLAYSASDGYIYVAFEEFTDGHPHIFVKRKKLTP